MQRVDDVNDFGCIPYECKSLNLYLLMYSDDIVLFSDSISGLQAQLARLTVKRLQRMAFRGQHREN